MKPWKKLILSLLVIFLCANLIGCIPFGKLNRRAKPAEPRVSKPKVSKPEAQKPAPKHLSAKEAKQIVLSLIPKKPKLLVILSMDFDVDEDDEIFVIYQRAGADPISSSTIVYFDWIGEEYKEKGTAENPGSAPILMEASVKTFYDSPSKQVLTTWTAGGTGVFPLALIFAFDEDGMYQATRLEGGDQGHIFGLDVDGDKLCEVISIFSIWDMETESHAEPHRLCIEYYEFKAADGRPSLSLLKRVETEKKYSKRPSDTELITFFKQ